MGKSPLKIAGWFISWKIPMENQWMITGGTPMTKRKPPYSSSSFVRNLGILMFLIPWLSTTTVCRPTLRCDAPGFCLMSFVFEFLQDVFIARKTGAPKMVDMPLYRKNVFPRVFPDVFPTLWTSTSSDLLQWSFQCRRFWHA